ncbi:MAG TPA: hypothetical protein VI386_17670 [Candidatus Sulfotelmatobacter sp.]
MTGPYNIAQEVVNELDRAQKMFGRIHNPHEALAIIREEYKEFEEEVFRHNLTKMRDCRSQMRAELIQLAAMCLRTIHDCID